MVSQAIADEYARFVFDLSTEYGRQVQSQVELVSQSIASRLVSSLSVKDGSVEQSPRNSSAILDTARFFKEDLVKSDFYPLTISLVSSFPSQVEYFRKMQDGSLSELFLPSDDHEILADQAGAAIGAIEGHVMKVEFDLRQFLSMSLGRVRLVDLARGINDIVTKITRVEQIAKNHSILWFRLLGHLVYSSAESAGYSIRYRYSGPKDAERDFCRDRLKAGVFSREEISAMDNEQVHDVFVNCGGFGCEHFWIGEVA